MQDHSLSISKEEKERLKNEFFSIVENNFVCGKDPVFDYRKVNCDSIIESQFLKLREEAEEEKYFNDD